MARLTLKVYGQVFLKRIEFMSLLKNRHIKSHLTTSTICFYISVGVMLGACSSQQPKETSAEKIINDVVIEQQSAPEVPLEVTQALLAGNTRSKNAKPRSQEQLRLDVSVNAIPARTFFLSLVSDSGINVVAHPEVSGSISLELKNVTIGEVLDVTRDVYGYEYKFDRGIYTIYPRKLRTEIFPVNYLDVQRVGVTDTSVLIGKITSNDNNSSGGSNNSGGSSSEGNDGANLLGYLEGEENEGGSSEQISPGTRVQTLSRTDFWRGLNETVLAMIGNEGDGRMVVTNPQAGLIVVKALPRELSAVRDFLQRSELSVKRQVVLETKILEVQLNNAYEAGINWGAISGQLSLQQTSSADGSLGDIIFGNEGIESSLVSSVLNVLDITKLLQLLEQQGNVQVLSSPRISTVNNQKAVIRVGSDEFFVTGISNSTTSSASSIVNTPEVELDSFFSGISLDVTPQISQDGDVILHVHPLVSNVQDQLKEIEVGGSTFSLPLALRDVRESDSIVKASSGQVVVLGGLMQERSTEVHKKRPILGDIPILNALFKSKQTSVVKTELVILMRPIVVTNGVWKDQIEQGANSIHLLSDEYRNR